MLFFFGWDTYYCIESLFSLVVLHAAALAGHASTVKLLLQNSAQVNMTDLQKHTPLFRACEMGHTNVVQTLIDNGARVDIQDQDGRSPLHWYVLPKASLYI